jgi:hypothetical protein
MAVKILIKRNIHEDRAKDLMPFFRQLRAMPVTSLATFLAKH